MRDGKLIVNSLHLAVDKVRQNEMKKLQTLLYQTAKDEFNYNIMSHNSVILSVEKSHRQYENLIS